VRRLRVEESGMRSTRTGTFLLLAALALTVRLAFFLAVRPWDPVVERDIIVRSDAVGYDLLARNLLEQGRFSREGSKPETLRTPLYPAFIAAVYAAFGPKPWVVLLFQTGLDALSCGLLYRGARRVLGQQAAVLAGVFFALDPTLVYASVTLMSETLFVLLCCLAFDGLVVAIARRHGASSRWPMGGAGFCFALAALVRPIALYVPYAIGLFLLISARRAPRDAFRSLAVFAVVFGATLAPWAVRNGVSSGAFAISSSGAYNLLVLNVGPMEMERRGQPMDEVKNALLAEANAALAAEGGDPSRANGFERAPYQSALARHYIAERPLAFAKFYAFGVFTSFANLGTRGYADWLGLRDVNDDRLDLRVYPSPVELVRAALAHKTPAEIWIGSVLAGFLFVFYPCVACGVAAARRSAGSERDLLWLCVTLVVYFVTLTGPAGLARFKIAALPFLDVLAGAGAVWLLAHVRRRALAPGVPAPVSPQLRPTVSSR
jgi:4-amino-4-deoxy-L-arabinose transferase-like glycosyltransferase